MKSSREDDKFWYPWHPGDYKRDTNVQSCSLLARGLWREMLDIMFYAPVRGTLTVGKSQKQAKQIDSKMLARMVGEPVADIEKCLSELDTNGVFSRLDDGTIYNRRMYKRTVDTDRLSAVRSEAGRRGAHAKHAGKPLANEKQNPPISQLHSHSHSKLHTKADPPDPPLRGDKPDAESSSLGSAHTPDPGKPKGQSTASLDVENAVDRLMGFEDDRNQGPATRAMWRARVRAMARSPNGLHAAHRLCDECESRRNPRVAETKGYSKDPIQDEPRWLNDMTRRWVEEHREKSAS